MVKRQDIRIRDPFISVEFGNKKYYMYGTTSLASKDSLVAKDKLLSKTFRDIISDLHRGGKYIKIETNESIVENFTKNFHDLHDNLKTNYRKLGKAIDMSIGNLTRLARGNEPMLASVIKLADFFGTSISQMLSDNPNFDYEKIQKEIEGKTSIANLQPVISGKKIKKDRDLRI